MKSQSVFKKCRDTVLFFTVALFSVHGPVYAVDAKPAGKLASEPCQLTLVEKYPERHPESQWSPSRREDIKRCDKVPDQQKTGITPVQGKKPENGTSVYRCCLCKRKTVEIIRTGTKTVGRQT